MQKAEAASNMDCRPVKISVVAPPLYALTTQTLDKVIEKHRMNSSLTVLEWSVSYL